MEEQNNIKSITNSKPVKTATNIVAAAGLVAVAGIFAWNKLFPSEEKKIKDSIRKYTVKYNKNGVTNIELSKLKNILKVYPTMLKNLGVYNNLQQIVKIAEDKGDTRVYWHPAPLAEKIYKKQKGINWSDSVLNLFTSGLWSIQAKKTTGYPELLKLNKDEIRLLHNYWLQKHGEGARLYEWVKGEIDVDGLKKDVINHLNRYGVGANVIKNM